MKPWKAISMRKSIIDMAKTFDHPNLDFGTMTLAWMIWNAQIVTKYHK